MIDVSICDEATHLLNHDRKNDYGDYTQNLRDIATGWSIIFNAPINPSDVARAMAWLKLVRASRKHKRDNYVDAIAYLLMADATDTKTHTFTTGTHKNMETR